MNITTLRIGCSNCNLREVCMPLGLTLKDMETVEELVSARRRIRRGEALYRAGDYFNNLYVVRLGFLKSTVMSSDGREQVTNFFMAGEMIGLDGISSNVYSCDVVALEDTEVCVLPFDRVEQALIRGVLVRIRNCTARTTANRTVLVIIIHIHRRTARAGANRPILVVIVIVHNRTAAGTWGVIVIEIIGTDSAARTTRTIILAIRVGHCGSGAARTAAGWTFGGILGIAGFIGIAGIG